MRTTLNIDDKIYQIVRSLADANHQSVSRTVDHLLTTALQGPSSTETVSRGASDPLTGFPIFRSQRVVTNEDVAALVSEE